MNDPKVAEALQTVIDYLDDLMVVEPSRKLADTSNFLQALLDKDD